MKTFDLQTTFLISAERFFALVWRDPSFKVQLHSAGGSAAADVSDWYAQGAVHRRVCFYTVAYKDEATGLGALPLPPRRAPPAC